MSTVYDFSANNIQGKSVKLNQFKGKAMLVVNTASACGFTPQFGGLEELHKKFGEKGLVVLGFPCNQFGSQDSGSNGEIAEFCQLNYGVSFPMMEKVDVNGGAAVACSALIAGVDGADGYYIKYLLGLAYAGTQQGQPH